MRLAGRRLHLNATARFGKITIEVLDESGRILALSKAVERDSLDIPVEWQEGELPGAQTPVTLRIKLENARLYALWCD